MLPQVTKGVTGPSAPESSDMNLLMRALCWGRNMTETLGHTVELSLVWKLDGGDPDMY